MHIKNIYVFACDLESNRGEGLLGLNFIKLLSKFHPNITFECVSPKAKFFLKNNNFKKELPLGARKCFFFLIVYSFISAMFQVF